MKPAHFLIVFYDGDCGFCNRSIQRILKNRKHDHFQFVALQSALAIELLKPFSIEISMETMYVLKENILFEKSNAALKIANELKMPYFLLKVGYILPKFIRDGLYSIIARNRHKLNKGFCVLPNETEKRLFSS
ncbi:MAG: thiol-disulfide oxidoreductase DCC family protein [Crocinitomicaceae bacterium]